MRLGIFGGSFDPPHIGHLLAASDAVEQLDLDRLVFLPAGTQPFKLGSEVTPASDRLEMTRLMVTGDARFEVDPAEIDRGGLSYTVDTLAAFAERDPGATRFLLIGDDLAEQIGSWREPERIAELAEIIVLTRGQAGRTGKSGAPALSLRRIETRRVDVSSSEIRERVRRGLSIHGFVVDAVAEYVASAGLYR